MNKTGKRSSLEFRKPALDSLSSTSNTYPLVRIATVKSWILLLVAFTIATFLIIWGIWGSITTWIEGEGILLPKKGSIYNIVSPSGPSHIEKLQISPRDIVNKGDLIATMSSPFLKKEVEVKKKISSDASGTV